MRTVAPSGLKMGFPSPGGATVRLAMPFRAWEALVLTQRRYPLIMQPYRRGAALLASLSVLALAGCHHDEAGTDSGGAMTIGGTNAIATVNGQAITQQEFFAQLQGYRPTPADAGPARRADRPAVAHQQPAGRTARAAAGRGPDGRTGGRPSTRRSSCPPRPRASSRSTRCWPRAATRLGRQGLPDQAADRPGQPDREGAAGDLRRRRQCVLCQHKAQFTEADRAHIKLIVLSNAADAQRIYGQIQKGSRSPPSSPSPSSTPSRTATCRCGWTWTGRRVRSWRRSSPPA